MHRSPALFFSTLLTAVLVGAGVPAVAQAAGKIVCWKDASGKVVGCGDTVPPEYRDNASKELDSRGVTRRTMESAEDAAKRREEEKDRARLKAAEEQRLAEQNRLDKTLLSTFNSADEIDKKRDRELQTIDLQLTQSEALLKGVAARHADLKGRIDALEKQKKPVPAALRDDYRSVSEDRERYEQAVATRKKEKDEVQKQYADYKARYLVLRGGASAGAAAPAKK